MKTRHNFNRGIRLDAICSQDDFRANMRTCKRCKTNEAVKGSLNCEKCNERNRKHTAKLIAESKAKNLHIPVVSESFTAEEVVNELEDCDTLDDAIMFFKEQM